MKVFKLGAFIFGLTCFTALTTTQAASLPAGNGGKSAKTFIYQSNAIFTIYCQAGRVSDIQLQPGEEIKSIGGGDSARWIVDKDISGTGGNRQWHVWIKPVASGIATNFIVNTDRRIYHLEAYGTINRSNPIVNWRYPQDERTALLRKQEEEQRVIAIKSLSFENLNFNYRISGRRYPWKPELVFDDGCKTYLKMPAAMKTSEAPALFIKSGKELLLVNYRVKNSYYIIDRLFNEAQLRLGIKAKVKIKKQKRPVPAE